MMYKKSRRAIDGYRRHLREHGVGAKALQWRDEESAKIRYEQMVADLDFQGRTILDVGCGFGDIVGWIEGKADQFEYTGVDVVSEFVDEAGRLHPEHRFIVGDYYAEPSLGEFDIVMSSGTMNANVADNMGFRKHAIKTLFENCKEACVFNMLGGVGDKAERRDGKVWYADKGKILEYCKGLSSRVILRDDYHKRDFTVVMYK